MHIMANNVTKFNIIIMLLQNYKIYKDERKFDFLQRWQTL